MTANPRQNPPATGIAAIGKPRLDELALRLERAVDTVQRLPRDAGTGPAGLRRAWPEMIRKSRFTIEITRRASRSLPSREAIDDLDRLAMLMWDVSPRLRQLLWARACRIRWAELCQRQRRSRTTLARDHRQALVALALAEVAADSS